MATEADDVPPLEDMSELLNQVEKLRELKSTGSHSYSEKPLQKPPKQQNGGISHTKKTEDKIGKKKEEKITLSNTDAKQTSGVTNHKQPEAPKKESFGGFKKGFLFGGKTASKSSVTKPKMQTPPKSQTETQEDIPFIKKRDASDTDPKLAFPEVQKAMEASNNLLQNKDWMTGGLLEKIEKNETLAKRLTDPSFVQAINEFQTNPQAAAAKYQDNPEVQKVFTEFCQIMGDHFTSLGDAQEKSTSTQHHKTEIKTQSSGEGADMSVRSSTNPNQATADDETKMQEILSNPEVSSILLDPWIQQLLGKLKNNPMEGQRFLQEGGHDKQMKLKKLVDAGILQFQR